MVVKIFLQQNPLVITWKCRLTSVDLFSGQKTVVFLCLQYCSQSDCTKIEFHVRVAIMLTGVSSGAAAS